MTTDPTPAEALANIQDILTLAEVWAEQNRARPAAIQKARRLFGPERGSE